MSNTIKALKDLGPYLLATAGTIFSVYLVTVIFGYLDLQVVDTLNLTNNTSDAVSAIVQTGATSVYGLGAIVLISIGLMALATVVSAFGFNGLDRFKISGSALTRLMTEVGTVVGIYAVIVMSLALLRIIFGYLDEQVTDSLGFEVGSWVMTRLADITGLMISVIDGITPLLSLGVGLVTLALVVKAFGFEIKFSYGKNKKGY